MESSHASELRDHGPARHVGRTLPTETQWSGDDTSWLGTSSTHGLVSVIPMILLRGSSPWPWTTAVCALQFNDFQHKDLGWKRGHWRCISVFHLLWITGSRCSKKKLSFSLSFSFTVCLFVHERGIKCCQWSAWRTVAIGLFVWLIMKQNEIIYNIAFLFSTNSTKVVLMKIHVEC